MVQLMAGTGCGCRSTARNLREVTAATQPSIQSRTSAHRMVPPTVNVGISASNCPNLGNVSQACLLVIDFSKLTIITATESDRNSRP